MSDRWRRVSGLASFSSQKPGGVSKQPSSPKSPMVTRSVTMPSRYVVRNPTMLSYEQILVASPCAKHDVCSIYWSFYASCFWWILGRSSSDKTVGGFGGSINDYQALGRKRLTKIIIKVGLKIALLSRSLRDIFTGLHHLKMQNTKQKPTALLPVTESPAGRSPEPSTGGGTAGGAVGMRPSPLGRSLVTALEAELDQVQSLHCELLRSF